MMEENLTEYLHKAATAGTLSHAYILEGTDRDALLFSASELARSVLCEGEKKPCGRCKACTKTEKGIHPDIIHVLPKKDRTTLGVDTVREISVDAYILPNEGKKKVYIFDAAETLTEQAQNALLKTIEEPPFHAVFLLLLKEEESLLATVRSRCVKLYVKSKADTKAKKQAEYAASFLKELSKGSEFDLMLLSNNLPKGREQLMEQFEAIRKMLRDLLIIKTKSNSELFYSDRKTEFEMLCDNFFTKQLVRLSDIAGESVKDIDTNSNISLSGILFFIKCWEEVH